MASRFTDTWAHITHEGKASMFQKQHTLGRIRSRLSYANVMASWAFSSRWAARPPRQ
jgi:hypothetical protein